MKIYKLFVNDYDDSYQILFTLEEEDIDKFYNALNSIKDSYKSLFIRKETIKEKILNMIDEEDSIESQVLYEELEEIEKNCCIETLMKKAGANILYSNSDTLITYSPANNSLKIKHR